MVLQASDGDLGLLISKTLARFCQAVTDAYASLTIKNGTTAFQEDSRTDL